MPKKEITAPSSLMLIDDTPDHVTNDAGIGNENVTVSTDDIPELKLIQKINDELDETKSKYIPGAKAGMMFNDQTREIMQEALVVNVYYDHFWMAWNKNTNYPFVDMVTNTKEFESKEALEQAINAMEFEDIENFDVRDTPRHYVLVLNLKTGKATGAIMQFPRTKAKVSNRWNNQIAAAGGDRFSAVWSVSGVTEENKKNGKSYLNYKIERKGWASPELHAKAEEAYRHLSGHVDQKAA
jgi:hypothetical protein